MAQYLCGCGHVQEYRLYGSARRKYHLNWMQSEAGMCNTCYTTYTQRAWQAARERELSKPIARSQINP